VQAVLAKMRHTNAVTTLPAPWRLLGIDGSPVQGPGAQSTQYRLHICRDLVQLQFWGLRDVLMCRVPPWPQPAGDEQAEGWEAVQRGSLSRGRASARPASRASPGVREPLGCPESPLT